jgi:hypothetical protein
MLKLSYCGTSNAKGRRGIEFALCGSTQKKGERGKPLEEGSIGK